MRRGRALLIVLGLLVASWTAAALPTPSPGPFLARAPITIYGDANFTAANGVVAGSGTSADPYVIAGWSIKTAGTGIRLYNVSAAYVVRDNAIEARTGIEVTQASGAGRIANNKIVARDSGVYVANADPLVVDNSFIGDQSSGSSPRGVRLFTSNARVESNAFIYILYGVAAERGGPTILCNDLHDDVIVAGVSVHATTNATIGCNVFSRCHTAISSSESIGTVVVNNTVSDCYVGVDVRTTKDATVANNTIRGSSQTQIFLDTVSGNATGNVVIDGRASGVVVVRSPMLVANNTISANARAGLVIDESNADVVANVVSNNSVGITLERGSVPHLVANVMANNTIGLNVPYGSRQAIVSMQANVVNGVNVDGTLAPSEKVYFYHAANVTITGQVRDSGFSAGYYGSLTAQGAIVLYEVDTATIEASVISHHAVGVGIVNAFNVNVNDSLLVSNQIGVQANATDIGAPVPPCVVGVKRTNVTIPVDPVATVGVDLRGCLGIVADVNVSVVDVGIRADGQASLQLRNTTVTATRIGLDVGGVPDGVNVTGALLAGNRVGARFSNTVGIVQDSRFEANVEAGVRLENGADLDFRRNNVTGNGEGVVDAEACAGPLSCSRLSMRDNVVIANEGRGLLVNGASTLRDDRFLDNGGEGARLGGGATMRGVLAAGNDGTGAVVVGVFDVRGSSFTDNGGHGLEARGNGELEDSAFLRNHDAGLRVSATYITAFGLNASYNRDGILTDEGAVSTSPFVPGLPPLNVPGLVGAATAALLGGGSPDPFDIHRSVFLGNERDAIRAGGGLINATHNYWGKATGPSVSVGDTVGAFQNGVSPFVRFAPYFTDEGMTTTGPVPGL